MGREQDWKNLGEQILDSVADALNTGDFKQLNNLVSGTVNDVVREAKTQAEAERNAREEYIREYQSHNADNYEKWQKQQEELRQRQEARREEWRKMREAQMNRRRQEQQAAKEEQGGNAAQNAPKRPPKAVKAKFNAVGSVANVLNTVFGALGLGVGVSLLFISMLLGVIFASAAAAPFFAFGFAAFGVSMGLLIKGKKQRDLLKRAQRYIQLCGTRMYANIEELASQTGQSVKFVRKDIKKMLRKGMFPEGHLDREENCFMLNDEVYRQYTETAQAYQMQDQMEAEKRARENRPLTQEEQASEAQRQQESELNAMMAEGMEYVRKLRELNDAIPGEEITNQLSQLESLLKQIFDRVREHPEQMHRMHKLMEYYLPTTVKLVEAYVQFEKVETPGRDIQGAKNEILKTLGIINEAFTELLNNLFQDEVFDATTDAQVLQTMLSREGLRHEMGAQQPVMNAQAQEEQEEEEQPFSFPTEPEQPEVLSNLKAPWES